MLKGLVVAMLVATGVQHDEMIMSKKALEDAGAQVHLVALESDTVQAWDWYAMKPHSTHPVDVQIDSAKAENYDALVIPGGLSNFDDLRVSRSTIAFVKAFADKPIAAICHGPCLLIDADLVKGKTVTSYPSIAQDLRNAGGTWVDKEVVRDGNLVTSRMPDDIPAFTQKTIEVFAESAGGLPHAVREKGFVYLHEVDPTIQISLRYLGDENFCGESITGYKKPVAIMTHATALALKQVQEEVSKDGYSLLVYDAYRPQCAVNHFMRWSKNLENQSKKQEYYPRVDKNSIIALGYVEEKSGHSRGSSVDITLIEKGKMPHAIHKVQRTLSDGCTYVYLDDGSVDMGSSFDMFDEASHYNTPLIAEPYASRRTYLKKAMEKHGFKGWKGEWWHFTLRDEPFSGKSAANYFDFSIV